MFVEDYIRRVLFLETVEREGEWVIHEGAVGEIGKTWVGYYTMSIWPEKKFVPWDSMADDGTNSIQVNPIEVLGLAKIGIVKWLSREDPEWFIPEKNSDIDDEQDY